MYKERKVRLRNKDGNMLSLLLREYRKGDEEGMISCICEEYGKTYFKNIFYQKEHIQKEAEQQHITFLVAQTENEEIAGMMILKQFYPEESMCEIASQIFRKKYRGYGLALPFFQYGIEILKTRRYTAAYCLPVVFHNITQVLLYRLGLHGTGFILNVFDMNRVTHSYDNGRNIKHSQAIQIMAMGKQTAGVLYFPEEHRIFASKVYENLSVSYSFASEDNQQKELMPDCSDITYFNDVTQSNLEIGIHGIGKDMKQRLQQLQQQFPFRGKQTVNIFLNCNDCHAMEAYSILKGMNFFFTGLKPLCSEKEYIILHNPGKIKIFFEDYVVSSEFASLLSYVKNCYECS